MRIFCTLTFLIFTSLSLSAQDLNTLIDRISEMSAKRALEDSTRGPYSYNQFVHFVKMDGDGEIEEQSERRFTVNVDSNGTRDRKLLSGRKWEDGEWTDVTEEEKNKKHKEKSHGVSFSLDEMFGTEARKNYQFKIVERPLYRGYETIRINAVYNDEDEDHFNGDLWIDKNSNNVIHAELQPSDNPTGVDSMIMKFDMAPFGGKWMPSQIEFEAEISFLFIFNGRIKSHIEFSDYRFNAAANTPASTE